MKNPGHLLMFILFVCLAMVASAKTIYRAPDSLQVFLQEKKGQVETGKIVLVGRIVGLVGRNSNLVVSISASPDISLDKKSLAFPAIDVPEEKTFEIVLQPGSGKLEDPYSWVRMKVDFEPDYGSLIAKVEGDKEEYLEDFPRHKLIKSLEKSRNDMVKLSKTVGLPYLSGIKFAEGGK
jgi:hypothetical protein